MSELTPEQLQEFKVTFAHFDCDGDNKLSIHEFRAGCQGTCVFYVTVANFNAVIFGNFLKTQNARKSL